MVPLDSVSKEAVRNVMLPLCVFGAAVVLMMVVTANSSEYAEQEYVPDRFPLPSANTMEPRAGLRIVEGKLKVVDWDEWMRTGPALVKVALMEGTESPEEITTNVLRRIFPEYPWPPGTEHEFYATWKKMNTIVGRALDQPTQPHLEVVS